MKADSKPVLRRREYQMLVKGKVIGKIFNYQHDKIN